MARVLTDPEIGQLLTETKSLPSNWESRLKPREKANQAYRQRELDIPREDGSGFRLILRQSALNPLDFSILLTLVDVDGTDYRLCRFNGRHPSQHTNKVEKSQRTGTQSFRNVFHIHRATERYQMAGYDIDGYAEPTTLYDSFEGALHRFLSLLGFVFPESERDQMELFRDEEGAES